MINCGVYAQDIDMGIASISAAGMHPISHTHRCNGVHQTQEGILFHECDCGATFYMLAEAVRILMDAYFEQRE